MGNSKISIPGYKWLSLTLRILLILLAFFLETYSLDVFKSGFPFWKTVLAFIIHSVPSIALLFVFWVAIYWEQIAGFTLICFALMGTLPAGPLNDKNLSAYIILGGIATIGILFVINYFFLGNRKKGEEF